MAPDSGIIDAFWKLAADGRVRMLAVFSRPRAGAVCLSGRARLFRAWIRQSPASVAATDEFGTQSRSVYWQAISQSIHGLHDVPEAGALDQSTGHSTATIRLSASEPGVPDGPHVTDLRQFGVSASDRWECLPLGVGDV